MKKNFPILLGIMFALLVVVFILTGQVGIKVEKSDIAFTFAAKNYSPVIQNFNTTATSSTNASSTLATVTKVFDGDTIEIKGGDHVRYIGVDAPEEWYSKKADSSNQCYAEESKKENEQLVLGKMVRLVKDTRDRDVYGRLLRYVYVQTTSSEIFINEELVQDGFTKATPYPPDVKYKDAFSILEKSAKESKRGLWGMCK